MARIRICLAVFTMVLFLIATSCSYADDMQETDNSFELTSIIEEYSEDSAAEVITTESATSIIPISREEAGLDPVMPIAELDESHIHPEIISASDLHRNLIQEWAWQDSWQILPDHYYQMGLEVSPEPQRDYIAVSKRWNGYIIGEITMQSTQADLLEALGEPGKKRAYDMNSGRQFFWSGSEDHGMYALFSDYDSQNDEIYNQQKELYENTKCWLWEYRTEQYYISFEGLAGSDTFDYVCFYKSPPLFDEKYQDILRVIIEDVIAYPDPNGTPIEDWENKWKGAEYLGGRNFAYGGRDIAYTTDGIVVEWIWGGRPNVYVYANFEGNLYQYQPDGEPAYVTYINSYEPVERRWGNAYAMPSNTFYTYLNFPAQHRLDHDPAFFTHISPDGRYSVHLDYFTNMYQYFLIHDNSGAANPYYITVPGMNNQFADQGVREFGWLDDTDKIWVRIKEYGSMDFSTDLFIIDIRESGFHSQEVAYFGDEYVDIIDRYSNTRKIPKAQ